MQSPIVVPFATPAIINHTTDNVDIKTELDENIAYSNEYATNEGDVDGTEVDIEEMETEDSLLEEMDYKHSSRQSRSNEENGDHKKVTAVQIPYIKLIRACKENYKTNVNKSENKQPGMNVNNNNISHNKPDKAEKSALSIIEQFCLTNPKGSISIKFKLNNTNGLCNSNKTMKMLENGKKSPSHINNKEKLEKSLTCGYCEKPFLAKNEMVEHMKRSHAADHLCSCNECGRTFNKQNELLLHMNIHDKSFACKLCTKTFTRLAYLRIHQRVHRREHDKKTGSDHTDIKTAKELFPCKHCTKTFSGLPYLRNHLKVHRRELAIAMKTGSDHKDIETDKKLFPCKHCTKTFSGLPYLRNHLKVHRRELAMKTGSDHKDIETDKKLFPCKHCTKTFSGLPYLRNHLKVHRRELAMKTGSDHRDIKTAKKLLPCKYCTKTFSRLPYLRNHQRVHRRELAMKTGSDHTDIKTDKKLFPCKHCTKTFSGLPYLRIHEKVHGREYVKKTGSEHIEIKTDNKLFACIECSKTFNALAYLRNHQKAHRREHIKKIHAVHNMGIHTKDELFACKLCTKTFSKLRFLKIHLKAHSRKHIMNIHADNKSFSCKLCTRTFDKKCHLGNHKKIHSRGKLTLHKCEQKTEYASEQETRTSEKAVECQKIDDGDEKPYYACELCTKTYSKLGFLRLHQKTHSKEKSPKFDSEKETRASEKAVESLKIDDCDQKPFACELCPKTYSKLGFLKFHQNTHSKEKPLEYGSKTETLISEKAVESLKIDDCDQKPFACELCPKTYSKLGFLKYHQKTHSKEKPLEFESEQGTCSSEKAVECLKIDGGDQKPFACELCPKTYSKLGFLKFHQKSHSKEKPLEFESEQGTYTSEKAVECLKIDGGDQKPFACELCPKTYSKLGFLKFHQKSHSKEKPLEFESEQGTCTSEKAVECLKIDGGDQKPFACELCPKTYSKLGFLKFHQKTHSQEKPLEFESEQGTRTSEKVVECQKIDDGDQKPFACELCPKTYSKLGFLRLHHKTHSRETLPEISCEQEIRSSGKSLVCQSKVNVSDDNAFACKLCSKSFRKLCYLRIHEKAHSREKPPECEGEQDMCTEEKPTEYGDEQEICSTENPTEYEGELEICSKKKPRENESEQETCSRDAPTEYESEQEPCSTDAPTEYESEQEMCSSVAPTEYEREHEMCSRDALTEYERQQEMCSRNSFAEYESVQEIASRDAPIQYGSEQKMRSTENSKEWQMNIHTHGDDEPYYACELCSETFSKLCYLKIHEKMHMKVNVDESFACEFCIKTFNTSGSLRIHQIIHCSEKPMEYNCEQKDNDNYNAVEKTNSSEKLMKNGYEQENKNGKEVTKFNCEQEFNSRVKQTEHNHEQKSNSGGDTKEYNCEKESNSQEEPIERNCEQENNSVGKPIEYNCKLDKIKYNCEQISNSGLELIDCEQESNNEEEPIEYNCEQDITIEETPLKYECEFCSVRFPDTTSLQKHMRTHTGERPYKCDLCETTFGQLTHLQQHIRRHTGELPYSCQECLKRFCQLSHLKQHERIHSGEKPYKCKICDKTFSQLSNLQQHERRHSGEKPYGCGTCSQTFRQLSNLQKHMRTHIEETPLNFYETSAPCRENGLLE